MKFIEVRLATGELPILVNAADVVFVRPNARTKAVGLQLRDGRELAIEESYDEVRDLLCVRPREEPEPDKKSRRKE